MRFNIKVSQFLFPLVLVGLMGCVSEDKNEDSVVNSKSAPNPFYIKNADNEIVSKIPPDLLLAIQKDLEKRGRKEDASGLNDAYDFKTGEALHQGLKKTSDWLYDAVNFKAYSLNQGWAPFWSTPSAALSTGYSSCANQQCTLAFDNPMTAYIVRRNTIPNIELGFSCYYENQAGVGVIYGPVHWNEIAGPGGNVGRIKAIMMSNWTEGYAVWYNAYMGNGVGWLSWTTSYQDAGIRTGNNYLKGFTMVVYKY